MFTGIVKTSKIKKITPLKGGLYVEIINNLGKIKLGESIAINGVCSTVVKTGKDLSFEYMPETLKLSNLAFLKKNDKVNIERSMRLRDRLDGHIVLGHIDTKGKIISIKNEGNSKIFEIKIPKGNFSKFLVYKGSIAIEGISLTIAKVLSRSFLTKIIPHTLKNTNLKDKKRGDFLNLEFDILAKYANKNKN